MKNYIKNLIGILAVATVLIGGAHSAFASTTYTIPDSNPNWNYAIYNSSGNFLIASSTTNEKTFPISSLGITGTTDTWISYSNGWTNNSGFFQGNGSTLAYVQSAGVINTTGTFVVPSSARAPYSGITFFGGTPTGGTQLTNTAFVGQVATALGATTTGIYPIVALVGGIILALILIGKIISMYKQAGATTDTKIKAGHTYNSFGKDLGKTPKHTLKMVRQGVWVRD